MKYEHLARPLRRGNTKIFLRRVFGRGCRLEDLTTGEEILWLVN